MRVADALALATGAAGVVAIVTATVFRGSWRLGLGMGLDLWLASGLLRLVGDPSWQRIAAAASVVALRRLIGPALRPSGPAAPAPATAR